MLKKLVCLFCDIKLRSSAASFEKHIRYGHGISKQRQLVISILTLGGEEVNELISQVQTRVAAFRASGAIPESSERIFKDNDLD